MMDEQLIEVTVQKDGSVHAETHNIHGPKCLDYIGLLEDLLEAEATASSFTRDYALATTSIADEAPARDRLEVDE
jgi:hypothetical protein